MTPARRPAPIADTVAVPRDLFERFMAALDQEMTKAGHYALKNDREHRGGCSEHRCWKPCLERKQLFVEGHRLLRESAPGALAAHRAPVQLELEVAG